MTAEAGLVKVSVRVSKRNSSACALHSPATTEHAPKSRGRFLWDFLSGESDYLRSCAGFKTMIGVGSCAPYAPCGCFGRAQEASLFPAAPKSQAIQALFSQLSALCSKPSPETVAEFPSPYAETFSPCIVCVCGALAGSATGP